MTVAIAVERYIGLCRPLRRLSGRPCAAKFYIIPVVAIALAVNVTKFLESETAVIGASHVTNETLTKVSRDEDYFSVAIDVSCHGSCVHVRKPILTI